MPYISETDYQNLHHTIVRLSESNEKLIARITALETAAKPFAHPDLCKRLPNNGTASDEKAVVFVRNNAVITLADCKCIAALLI